MLELNNKLKYNFRVANSKCKSKIKFLSYQYNTKQYPKRMILSNLSRYRSSSAYKQSLIVNIMSKKKFFLKYLATCRTKLVPKLI